MPCYDAKGSRLRLVVKVRPNAKTTGIREVTDTQIVISVGVFLILDWCSSSRQQSQQGTDRIRLRNIWCSKAICQDC